MIVVLDSNALVQVFGQAPPFAPLREALRSGRVEWAISTPILLEYEEVVRRSSYQFVFESGLSARLEVRPVLESPSCTDAGLPTLSNELV